MYKRALLVHLSVLGSETKYFARMSRRPTCDEDISHTFAAQTSLQCQKESGSLKTASEVQCNQVGINNKLATTTGTSNLTSMDNVISFADGIRIDDGTTNASRSTKFRSTNAKSSLGSKNQYNNSVFCTCDEPVFPSYSSQTGTTSSVMVDRAINRYMNSQDRIR